jgi:hypothetical protein
MCGRYCLYATMLAALQQKSRHFLNKQRHAAALSQAVKRFLGQRMVGRKPTDHVAYLLTIERRQRNYAMMQPGTHVFEHFARRNRSELRTKIGTFVTLHNTFRNCPCYLLFISQMLAAWWLRRAELFSQPRLLPGLFWQHLPATFRGHRLPYRFSLRRSAFCRLASRVA